VSNPDLWFKSGLFDIAPGEDAATIPRCFGKRLANWLRAKLMEKGYNVEDVIPEDWGWCVMCARKPFKLWVGCGSVWDLQKAPEGPCPTSKDVTWTCFVAAEKPLLTGLLTRIDPTAVPKLFKEIEGLLNAEPEIELTGEPPRIA
jgi:hypothetical protein